MSAKATAPSTEATAPSTATALKATAPGAAVLSVAVVDVDSYFIIIKQNMLNRYSGFVLLKDPKIDCPCPTCDGWLNLYGTSKGEVPTYFQCSNKCNQRTIFSKKITLCKGCDANINLKDIITTAWDQSWVHLGCAHRRPQPSNVYAVCLRCKMNINDPEDALPSKNHGVDGFIHKQCASARKRMRECDDATDSEFTNSQGSDTTFV